MRRESTKEGALLRLALDWLAAERILAFRMNTGAVQTGRRFFRFGTPGMADILAFACRPPLLTRELEIPRVTPVWLEMKAGTKQSEAQKSFQRRVEEAGHIYRVCYSLEDVKAAVL